jgi:hypothetical protein
MVLKSVSLLQEHTNLLYKHLLFKGGADTFRNPIK